MISTEAEEPISRRDKAGTRVFPGVRRAWLFSVVVHIVVLLIVVVLALHPGKVLAPRSQGDSSQGEGSLLRASLVSRLPQQRLERAPAVVSTSQQNVLAPGSVPDKQASAHQPKAEDHPVRPMVTPQTSRSKAATLPKVVTSSPVVKTSSGHKHDGATASAPTAEPVVANAMAPRQKAEGNLIQKSPSALSTAPMTGKPVAQDAQDSKVMAHSGEPLLVAARYAGTPQQADYPALARRLGQQGRVVVEVWLDAKGEQEKRLVVESSGHALLDRAALAAVARNAFLPYSQNGMAHPSRLRVPIEFKLLAR